MIEFLAWGILIYVLVALGVFVWYGILGKELPGYDNDGGSHR